MMQAKECYDKAERECSWDFTSTFSSPYAKAEPLVSSDNDEAFHPLLVGKLFGKQREPGYDPRDFFHGLDQDTIQALWLWHQKPMNYEKLCTLTVEQFAKVLETLRPHVEILYHMVVNFLGPKDNDENDVAHDLYKTLCQNDSSQYCLEAVWLYTMLVRNPGTKHWRDFNQNAEFVREWVVDVECSMTDDSSDFIHPFRNVSVLYALELNDISLDDLQKAQAQKDAEDEERENPKRRKWNN